MSAERDGQQLVVTSRSARVRSEAMVFKFEIRREGELLETEELQSGTLTAAQAKAALRETDASYTGKLVQAGSSLNLLGTSPLDPSQTYQLQLTRAGSTLL